MKFLTHFVINNAGHIIPVFSKLACPPTSRFVAYVFIPLIWFPFFFAPPFFLCVLPTPTFAQNQILLSIPVDAVYQPGQQPSWRLEADMTEPDLFGLFREGDRITLGLNTLSTVSVLGVWEEEYRHEEKDCGIFNIFCSKIINKGFCPIEVQEHPTRNGNVSITVSFLREGVKGDRSVAHKIDLGAHSLSARDDYYPQGPQFMKISGGIRIPLPECAHPPKGERVRGPTKLSRTGVPPSPWFRIFVKVHPPELDH